MLFTASFVTLLTLAMLAASLLLAVSTEAVLSAIGIESEQQLRKLKQQDISS